MAKSREIKRRIKAVGNIRRITKTMQMIATARFQAAQRRATASRPYTRKIAELVGELASSSSATGAISHPLLASDRPKSGRELVLVITSNRGLCGGYNANVLRSAAGVLRDRKDRQIDLEIVGKKGLAFFKFMGQTVSEFHGQFGDQPSYESVEKLAEKYMAAYIEGKYDAVTVVFMSFVSMSRQVPCVHRLLPLDKPEGDAAEAGSAPAAGSSGSGGSGDSGGSGGGSAKPVTKVQYDFTPDPSVLLKELLPITVETGLFQCFNEAVVSEQIARMVAMKAATDSAGKMGKELSRKFNRARQAAITTELSEIIAGAASLE